MQHNATQQRQIEPRSLQIIVPGISQCHKPYVKTTAMVLLTQATKVNVRSHEMKRSRQNA
jgi:hypothetical protein